MLDTLVPNMDKRLIKRNIEKGGYRQPEYKYLRFVEKRHIMIGIFSFTGEVWFMQQILKLIVVDSNRLVFDQITNIFQLTNFKPTFEWVKNQATMQAALSKGNWDTVIINESNMSFPLEEVIMNVKALKPELPLLVVSGDIDIQQRLALEKLGVYDFIHNKNLENIPIVIKRVFKERHLIEEINQISRKYIASEERYHRLMRYSSDAMFAFDRNGNYLHVNEAFARVFGKRVDEIIGRNLREIFDPEDENQRLKAIREVFSSGKPKQIEVLVPRHNNSKGIYLTQIDPVLGSDGTVESVVCVSRDITEQKEAEMERKASEKRGRDMFERHTAAMLLIDTDTGNIFDANPAAVKFYGFTNEQFRRMNISDLDKLPMEEAASRYWQTLEDIDANHVFAHYMADGSVRWVEVNTSLLYVYRRPKLLAVIRDITRRKLAEEENVRLRNLLNNIIDSMPSLLVAVDVGGTVVEWNAESALQTGISREEALGKPISEIMPQFGQMMETLNWDIHRLNAEYKHHAMLVTDGKPRHYNIMLYPLVINEASGAVIRIDDITEQVLMQDMITRSEKAMSVSGTAAGMTHEISNPLSGILQAAQNIEQRLLVDKDQNRDAAAQCGTTMEIINCYMERRKIVGFIKGIRTGGQKIASIIENMLHFSRFDEEQQQPVDLASLLDTCIELAGNDFDLRTQFDFRHIEIERHYDPDLGLVVCSAIEIEQVILNLLKNAAYAMFDKSNKNHEPKIVLRTFKQDNMAVVEVEDNGSGITEDVKKRIFEPFYTTKPVDRGSGLGLAVSQHIITDHHYGRILVESEPGEGSRFIVQLPMRTPDELNCK